MNEDSDVMYRLLVQSVEDYAIYMLTPEGIVANWNAGAQRAKGYTRDEIVGKHFSCFYISEDRDSGWPAHGLETARRTGRYESEGWRQRKDGSRFWAHVIIEAVRESGTLLGFAKVTRDVSERRLYEQELLAAKEFAEASNEKMTALSQFLDTVIANIPSSVIVENAVSREILLVNRQAELLLPPAPISGNKKSATSADFLFFKTPNPSSKSFVLQEGGKLRLPMSLHK